MAGLLGNSYDPYGGMSSLLGVDMDAMRKQALWNGLAAAGFSLMGNKNMGAAGGAFLLGTNQARDDYMNTALDAYRLKQAEEQQAYQRDRDAAADERWQTQWDYNVGRDAQADERQSRQDAWTNTQNQRTMEDWQRQDDQRQQQQDYVTGWMGQQEQAGVNVLPPNVRDIARQGGVQGMVSPVDEWRYGQAQPYAGMGDYENAFKGITAEPPAPEQYTLGEGQIRYSGATPIAAGPQKQEAPRTRNYLKGNDRIYEELTPDGWVEIGRGPANAGAPSTTINNLPAGQEPPDTDLRKKLSEKEADTWVNYELAADQSGGLVQQLQIVDELAKMAPQGPIQGRLAELFPGFSSAGDAIVSITTRIAPSLRTPGSGSQSDREFEAFLASFPRLRNLPEANALISGVLQAKAQLDIQRGEIVAAYRNNEISAVDARKQLSALRRVSILTPDIQRLIDAAGGASPVSELSDDELLKQLKGGQ